MTDLRTIEKSCCGPVPSSCRAHRRRVHSAAPSHPHRQAPKGSGRIHEIKDCRHPSDLRRSCDWILRSLFDLALNLKCVPSIFESGCHFTLSGSIRQRRRSNAPTNTRRKHHTHRVDPFWPCFCKCLGLSSVPALRRSIFVRSYAALQRKSPS